MFESTFELTALPLKSFHLRFHCRHEDRPVAIFPERDPGAPT